MIAWCGAVMFDMYIYLPIFCIYIFTEQIVPFLTQLSGHDSVNALVVQVCPSPSSTRAVRFASAYLYYIYLGRRYKAYCSCVWLEVPDVAMYVLCEVREVRVKCEVS